MTAVALEATPSRARTWWVVPALAAIVAGAGVWWSIAPYLVGVFHDDGVYALLARSIASGEGFHYSHLPGMPAATHYPPLYPLVLAALWRLAPDFPGNVSLLLGANAFFAALAAAGATAFAARRLGWRAPAAAVCAVVVMLTTPMLTLAGALLSELLFIALLWLVLLVAERAASAEQGSAALAGGAIGALMLVRTHAVALLVALVVLLMLSRRHRAAATALGAALLVQLPWMLWSSVAAPRVAAPLEGSYGSYLGWFVAGLREGGAGFVLDTARMNLRELGLLLRDRFTTGIGMVDVVSTLLVSAALAAGARSFARRAPVTLLFLAAYLAIVVVWPYSPWRFAWAVWPLAALMIAEGVRDVAARSPRWRMIAAFAAVLPALGMLRTELHSYASRAWRAPARQAAAQLMPVVAWARANTVPSDVLLAEGEQVIALYAGRQAAPPVSFTALEYARPSQARVARSLAEMLRAVPATHLVTLTPGVQLAAAALNDPAITLAHMDAPAGAAAFKVTR